MGELLSEPRLLNAPPVAAAGLRLVPVFPGLPPWRLRPALARVRVGVPLRRPVVPFGAVGPGAAVRLDASSVAFRVAADARLREGRKFDDASEKKQ